MRHDQTTADGSEDALLWDGDLEKSDRQTAVIL